VGAQRVQEWSATKCWKTGTRGGERTQEEPQEDEEHSATAATVPHCSCKVYDTACNRPGFVEERTDARRGEVTFPTQRANECVRKAGFRRSAAGLRGHPNRRGLHPSKPPKPGHPPRGRGVPNLLLPGGTAAPSLAFGPRGPRGPPTPCTRAPSSLLPAGPGQVRP
jgi:hypothetical protein